MDPRHPELAVSRIDELITQYKRVLKDIENCEASTRLGSFEREGGLVVQEICLVAPRLHEALIKVSRERRVRIMNGTAVSAPKTGEVYVAPNQAEVYIAEPKYKKKTTKKKTTKKVEEDGNN